MAELWFAFLLLLGLIIAAFIWCFLEQRRFDKQLADEIKRASRKPYTKPTLVKDE